jgi:hypothetical protein
MAIIFNWDTEAWAEVELGKNDLGQFLLNGEVVLSFVTTYTSIGGPKACLMSWDEEVATYTPWNTWYAASSPDAAWNDAQSWAAAEDIPAIRGI